MISAKALSWHIGTLAYSSYLEAGRQEYGLNPEIEANLRLYSKNLIFKAKH